MVIIKKYGLLVGTALFFGALCSKEGGARPYVRFQDQKLFELEVQAKAYMPQAISLMFCKWRFLMTVSDKHFSDSKYSALVASIPVHLEDIAYAQACGHVLDPEVRMLHEKSLLMIKTVLNKESLAVKEVAKIQKISYKVITFLCEQRGLTDSLIYKWACTFPAFCQEDELMSLSALELYKEIIELREVYRDIVLNFEKSHQHFRKVYFSFKNQDMISVFDRFIMGDSWGNFCPWER